jgi:hypothetical protein
MEPGRRRDRFVEEGGVTVQDLRYPQDVVEADERLGDDEAGFRQPRSVVWKRDGRLQTRHVVVADVADDRRVQRLRLVEVAETVAAAHEAVAAEAAVLDRLE